MFQNGDLIWESSSFEAWYDQLNIKWIWFWTKYFQFLNLLRKLFRNLKIDGNEGRKRTFDIDVLIDDQLFLIFTSIQVCSWTMMIKHAPDKLLYYY